MENQIEIYSSNTQIQNKLINEKSQLKELIYAFLKEKSKNTQIMYQAHIKEFFTFIDSLNTTLKHARYTHLIAYREYLLSRELSDNTINAKIASIKSFFKFLSRPFDDEGNVYLENNIAQHLTRMKVNPYDHSQTFDVDLYKKIIKDINEENVVELRDKTMFLIFGLCGLRKSEVRFMKVNSIKEEMGIPYYKIKGKGNKVIEKELDDIVYSLIQQLIKKLRLKEPDYLFQNLSNNSRKGMPLSHAGINYILNHYVKKYGFSKNFRVHSLRSMSAYALLKQTKDITEVQKHLNHSNIATTQIYLNKLQNKKVGYYKKLEKELLG